MIPGGDVEDLEGNLQRLEELLLETEESLVPVLGVLGQAVDEHLDLVEPVDAENAAGVLAVGTGLAAEAGAERGVAAWQGIGVEDFVAVESRQGHLGCADEVEVVGGEMIDVLGGLTEETGAGHRLGFHQRRGDHGGESPLDGLGHGQVQQRELQARANAGEHVEPRPGDLRAAFHVDGA